MEQWYSHCLDATFNATILPLFSSDSGKQLEHSPVSVSTSNVQLRRKLNETTSGEGNKQADASLVNCVQDGIDSSEKAGKNVLIINVRNGKFEKQGRRGMVLQDGDQVSPLQSSELKDNLSPVELDTMNQISDLSPGSSLSFSDAKEADGSTGIAPSLI